MRLKFEKVVHLVDSETVLNQLNKTSYRFKAYEGVRIGEIQAATNGSLDEWFWLSGSNNIADWVTRGRSPMQLKLDSEWFSGPSMFQQPFEDWNVKSGTTMNETLPGEKKISSSLTAKGGHKEEILDYSRVSNINTAIRVIARLLCIAEHKTFKGGSSINVKPQVMMRAEQLLIKEAQEQVDMNNQSYKKLNPKRDYDGIWVVGTTRLVEFNPLGVIHSNLPIFLPYDHSFTRLAMKAAHEKGHRGRDATLATFRGRFWTPKGSKLAKRIRNEWQMCKLRDAKALNQEMGRLPIERLKPSPPFTFTMVDLFGPYAVRGEVQKRITGKAWGVIFTDMCSRAVHIEVVFGCDISNFMMALSRFVSIRGWPQKLYSDPGTQLVGANNELKQAIVKSGSENGMEWVFGVPDSPWHQGAVESLIKSVKRTLDFSIHNQRLSGPEFLTVCSEAANLINARPLGLLPDLESNINILTPNCLLLGRATASNPNSWQPDTSLNTRHNLVTAIGNQFWQHWLELFAPSLVYRPKWSQRERDLKIGDVVLILDNDALKGEYRLGLVLEVHPGKDGRVRNATVAYKNFKVGESVQIYKGQKYTSVKRSIQRLVLLVPVD